jgi:hypothetical protein
MAAANVGGDAAAAAASMAAAVMSTPGAAKEAGKGNFSFTDFFLAYMCSQQQDTQGASTAHNIAAQLAQQHQNAAKRTAAPGVSEEEKQAVDPRKYKTRMCRNWETKGHCPYEHTCCFAHGPDEIRDLTSNHKMLASIGYFSNIILLSMSNGTKPALPPHCLYQQPQMLAAPQSPEDLKKATETLPEGVHFPFQDPMPAALRGLKKEVKAKQHATKPTKELDAGLVTAEGEEEGGKKRSRRRRRGKKDRGDGKLGGEAFSDGGEGEDVAA